MSRNTRPTRSAEGLRSEALREALQEALANKPVRLEQLLMTHSAIPSPHPNLPLAAAFGNELATLPGIVGPLLQRLGAYDAAPDDPHVFLPLTAAHGWAGRIRAGREVEPAWLALCELAADERGPVRIGTLDALITLGARPGGGDELIMRGTSWLEVEDRELRFGATALVLEALSDRGVNATVDDGPAFTQYLEAVIDLIVSATRAAERSEGRRRIFMSLPSVFASIATALRAGDTGLDWLREQCSRAEHPDIRKAFSQSIETLRTRGNLGHHVIESLKQALEASAKPARDHARVRMKPGGGRGRRSRQVR